ITVSVLLVNAIAVLSEDRFLARIGWGSSQQQAEPSFGGGGQDNASVKAKMINLINSVRTLMRSTFCASYPRPLGSISCLQLWGPDSSPHTQTHISASRATVLTYMPL
ncbi:Yos1-domain-containing protein, partial [Dissoconium aciculare CBS 342.82]|uniref:Yos1-domain-containing protein n=1 Tax=Dissoconium aciculare CBS 342.82 TaxID=1314786 RepID=A0A6J3LV22_9PEZI